MTSNHLAGRPLASGLALAVGGGTILALALGAPQLVGWIPLRRFGLVVLALGAFGWGIDRLVRVWQPVTPRSYFRGRFGAVRLVTLTCYCAFVIADIAYLIASRLITLGR